PLLVSKVAVLAMIASPFTSCPEYRPGLDCSYNTIMHAFLAILILLSGQDLPGARKPKKEKPAVQVVAVRPEKADARPGEVVKVAFDLEIPKTWHIYPAGKKPFFGNQTFFVFENAEIAGKIEEPPPILKEEEGIGKID